MHCCFPSLKHKRQQCIRAEPCRFLLQCRCLGIALQRVGKRPSAQVFSPSSHFAASSTHALSSLSGPSRYCADASRSRALAIALHARFNQTCFCTAMSFTLTGIAAGSNCTVAAPRLVVSPSGSPDRHCVAQQPGPAVQLASLPPARLLLAPNPNPLPRSLFCSNTMRRRWAAQANQRQAQSASNAAPGHSAQPCIDLSTQVTESASLAPALPDTLDYGDASQGTEDFGDIAPTQLGLTLHLCVFHGRRGACAACTAFSQRRAALPGRV